MLPLKQIWVSSLWLQGLNIAAFEQPCTASRNLIISRVCEVSWVLGISVFLCWLAYLATMHMKLQLLQSLASSQLMWINQSTGGSKLQKLWKWILNKWCHIKDTIILQNFWWLLCLVQDCWSASWNFEHQVKLSSFHNIITLNIYKTDRVILQRQLYMKLHHHQVDICLNIVRQQGFI